MVRCSGGLKFFRALRGAALLLLAPGMLMAAAPAPLRSWQATSPDGHVTIQLREAAGGELEYRVARDAAAMVGWSKLGIIVSSIDAQGREERHDFTRALRFVAEDGGQVCDHYVLKSGKRLVNDVCGNRVIVDMQDGANDRIAVEARAYDDGAAFRYLLRASGTRADAVYKRLDGEATTFNMDSASRFFGLPYDVAEGSRPSYETPPITAGLPTGSSTRDSLAKGWALPMLFQVGASWVLVHEGGLLGQSFGSHIAPKVVDKVYTVAAPLAGEALGEGDTEARFVTPWESPWRLFVVGDLATVAGSNLVQTLAPPSRVENDDWVKPGKASWSWLSDHASSTNPDALRPFIDLAGEMGWSYSLIDANWNEIDGARFAALLDYAGSRHVGLFLWYNSGGLNNAVPEAPRNLMDDAAKRDAEFARIEELGIKGIKVDFWESDKQFMMQRYIALLSDAARHHLMVNFHGSTVPRGWERTFPNLVTMEAVRGDEYYSFPSTPDYGALAPSQNALVPFTRNAVGPMDATPMLFAPKMVARRTTAAHEAALGIIFQSGVQHLSDGPEAYLSLPPSWRQYLRDLPTAWDDTRLLAGEPGKFAVIARRKGTRWWVGGINGEGQPRTLSLDLSFMTGRLDLLSDDKQGRPSPGSEVLPRQKQMVRLLPFGGFVMAPSQSDEAAPNSQHQKKQ